NAHAPLSTVECQLPPAYAAPSIERTAPVRNAWMRIPGMPWYGWAQPSSVDLIGGIGSDCWQAETESREKEKRAAASPARKRGRGFKTSNTRANRARSR